RHQQIDEQSRGQGQGQPIQNGHVCDLSFERPLPLEGKSPQRGRKEAIQGRVGRHKESVKSGADSAWDSNRPGTAPRPVT
ncbi:hypothetical protein, partial [Salmonella sp. SAL04281]|uniref:hypothetical protein n=1 Tax=Salmonella sp. SAL04281 TaxID=3159859 RepID=UPI0039790A71